MTATKVVMLNVLASVCAVLAFACAVKARPNVPATRPLMEWSPERRAFLVPAPLEQDGNVRDLIIGLEVSDDSRICFDLTKPTGEKGEVCMVVGLIRAAGAAKP